MSRGPNFRLRPPRVPPLAENDVERQCLDLLRVRHYRPERLQAGRVKTLDGRFMTLHPKGTPDYVVPHPIFPAFYLEVKRPGNDPSPEQERKHLELRLCGFSVTTADSIEAMVAWLKEHERESRARWQAALARGP